MSKNKANGRVKTSKKPAPKAATLPALGDVLNLTDVGLVKVCHVNAGMYWVSPVKGDTHVAIARIESNGKVTKL